MDSSRSGLLSTLIMTVPLVVVPAMALLRPAGPVPGVSTTPLDASLDQDDLLSDWDFDSLDPDNPSNDSPRAKKQSNPDGTNDTPDNPQEPAAPPARKPETETPPDASGSPGSETLVQPPYEPDPFDPRPPSPEAAVPPQTPNSSKPVPMPAVPPPQQLEELLLKQIRSQGATTTLWFSPGATSDYGFVAFVKRESPAVSYRFEAVGATRVQAIQGVLDQLVEWQKTHPNFAP